MSETTTINTTQVSSVLSYKEWLKSKWHGIPMWVIFTLALAYNLFSGITLFGVIFPFLMSLAWYQHYSYYAKHSDKKNKTSTTTKVVTFLVIAVLLFAIIVGLLGS